MCPASKACRSLSVAFTCPVYPSCACPLQESACTCQRARLLPLVYSKQGSLFCVCQVFGEQCGQHSCLTSPPWPFDSCIRRLAEMGCLTCTVSRSRMHATRSRSTFNAAIRRRKEGPGCNQTMTTCRLGGHLELGLRLCRALAVLHQRPEACVELRSRPGAECHAARPAASVRC